MDDATLDNIEENLRSCCTCEPESGIDPCNWCKTADALAKLRADLQRSEFKRAQYEERLGMVDAQMLHIINENNARWRKRDAEMAELEKDRARLDFLLAGPAGICIGLKWGAVSTREEIDNVMKEE